MFPHALMFHHFHDEVHPPGQGALNAAGFEEMLRFFGLNRLLPAGEWMSRMLDGSLGDDQCCITLDDGLRCQFDVALPVMERLGLTAFWYVNTSPWEGTVEKLELYRYFRSVRYPDIEDFYVDFFKEIVLSPLAAKVSDALKGFVAKDYLSQFPFYTDGDRKFRYVRDRVLGPEAYNRIMDAMIERAGLDLRQVHDLLWLKPDHVRALQNKGHVVGLHTHTHPTVLVDMPPAEQELEYRRNSDMLAEVLGEKPITSSHPCNSYNSATLDILKEMGVRLAFRSNLAEGDIRTALTMPREDQANIFAKMKAA